jgi:hypothetical protein
MSALPLVRDVAVPASKPTHVISRSRSTRRKTAPQQTARQQTARQRTTVQQQARQAAATPLITPLVGRRAEQSVKPNLVVVARKRRWPAIVAGLAWSTLFVGLLGAAVFHTQLAERQLRIDRLERAVAEQRELFDELRYERAELRSPVRLAEAAGAMGMERGDTGEFVRVTPEALARQIAAAGSIDGGTSKVIIDTDPLQQFRDVKAVTEGQS